MAGTTSREETRAPSGEQEGITVDAGERLGAAGYIADRLGQYQDWYNRKAVTAKRRYLLMRSVSVLAGAVVPVLVNLDADYVNIVTTVLSIIVVAVVSLESVYHYREQWKNYRSTEQYLGRKLVWFQTGVGPYEDVDRGVAFRQLVERVETAIASENAATLNTMTLVGEAAGDSGS